MAFPLMIAASLASKFLPGLVGKIAGSKGEQIAQSVMGIAQEVTGIPLASMDEKNQERAISEAISADPELAARLREKLVTLDADLDKAYLQDRQDARQRDAKFIDSGVQNWTRIGLMGGAFAIVLISMGVLVFAPELNDKADALLTTILTLSVFVLKDASQFEFGSSRGSKNKDAK